MSKNGSARCKANVQLYTGYCQLRSNDVAKIYVKRDHGYSHLNDLGRNLSSTI